MKILTSLMLFLSYISFGQCVDYADISTVNYSQSLTQSNTYIKISSSINSSNIVKFDSNPSNGYVLMNPGFIAAPTGKNAFIAQSLDGCSNLIPLKGTNIILENIVDKKIEIYPNPTTDYLKIKSNIYILNYNIISIEGKEINISRQLNNKEVKIDVSTLSEGFYVLSFETITNEILIYKFLKK